MPMRRGGTRRTRPPLRWTGLVAELALDLAIADSFAGLPIVVPTDYDFSAGSTEPSGAVLKRMRGSLSFKQSGSTGGFPIVGAYCQLGIGVFDSDVILQGGGVGDPKFTSELVKQDWLWTYNLPLETLAIDEVVTLHSGLPAIVDVKAQRRLKDSTVFLIASVIGGAAPAGLPTFRMWFCLRALLAMKASG